MGTISDKLTYLNTTKSQLKDMINNGLDDNNKITSSTTFRNYVTSIFNAFLEALRTPDTLFTNLPKKSGTGANITLNDTANAPMRITLGSRALEQKTNLFKGGIEQGSLVNGEPSTGSNRVRTIDYISVVPNTTIPISFTGLNQYVAVNYNSSKSYVSQINWANSGTDYTIPNNTYYIKLIFKNTTGTDITPSSLTSLQVGNPPNPSYPQDIHTISGSNTIKVYGNLFDISTITENTYLDGGTGNTGTSSVTNLSDYIELKDTTDCYLDYDYTSLLNSGSRSYCFYNSSKTYISGNSYTATDKKHTITTPSNAKYIRFAYDKNCTDIKFYQTLETKDIDLKSKNLLNNNVYATKADMVLTPIETGMRAICTTTSSASNTNIGLSIVVCDITPYIGQKITLSAHAKSSSTNKGFMYLRLCKANGDTTNDYGTITSSSTLDGDISVSYTIPSGIGEYHYISATLYSTRNGAVNKNDYVDYTNLQLEVGDKTDYEPYYDYGECGSIGNYENIPIRTFGKNLLDKDNANILNNTLLNGTTGIITSFNGCKSLYISIESSTTYTISKILSARFAVGTCVSTPANSVTCNVYSQDNTATSITITSGASDKYLCVFYYLSGTDTLTDTAILNSIQIEKGNQATSYEPYGNGTWYLKQEIGKYVFTGNENITLNYPGETYQYYFIELPNKAYSNNNVNLNNFSTHFVSVQNAIAELSDGKFTISGTGNLVVCDTRNNSVENFKTWLTTNQPVFEYILATPTYTPITGTLAEQLENVYQKMLSQKGQTNISQVNDDLSFNLSVQAIEEL